MRAGMYDNYVQTIGFFFFFSSFLLVLAQPFFVVCKKKTLLVKEKCYNLGFFVKTLLLCVCVCVCRVLITGKEARKKERKREEGGVVFFVNSLIKNSLESSRINKNG